MANRDYNWLDDDGSDRAAKLERELADAIAQLAVAQAEIQDLTQRLASALRASEGPPRDTASAPRARPRRDSGTFASRSSRAPANGARPAPASPRGKKHSASARNG